MTVQQVAEQLGVAATTVYGLCQQNALRHFRVGRGRGTIRVREEDLRDYIEAAVVRPQEQPPTRSRPRRHKR